MKKNRYTVKNPFLYFYLRALDFVFFWIPLLKSNRQKPQIKKILVVQLAHIGDLILSTSIFPVIKKKYPSAKIDILIGSWSGEIIHNHPLVNHIYYLDHPKNNRRNIHLIKKFVKFLLQWFCLTKLLKKNNYDVSIDLSVYYPNSHVLTHFAKIPKTIGYGNGGASSFLTNVFNWSFCEDHISLSYEKLLGDIDISPSQTLFLSPYLAYIQKKPKRSKENPYIIFHPFSGDPKKNWKNVSWVKLLHLFSNTHFKIIFTGKGQLERTQVRNMIKDFGFAENCISSYSIEELQNIVYYSKLVISVDTMLGHLAAALDVPTISIFNNFSNPKIWHPPSNNAHFLSPSKHSASTDVPSALEVYQLVNKVLQIRTPL